MDLNLKQYFRKDSLLVNIIFYLSLVILFLAVFSYVIFSYKIYLQNSMLSEVKEKLLSFNSEQQKEYEKRVTDYKNKIEDYNSIAKDHKFTSNIFKFIEERTLANVWFAVFEMSAANNEVRLSGETENMESLGRQVRAFEKEKDFVKNITILNSSVDSDGKVKFALSFNMDPKIFSYSIFK